MPGYTGSTGRVGTGNMRSQAGRTGARTASGRGTNSRIQVAWCKGGKGTVGGQATVGTGTSERQVVGEKDRKQGEEVRPFGSTTYCPIAATCPAAVMGG